MKSVLSLVVLALLVGMVVPVGATEEAESVTADPVEQQAAEFSADQWLEAQSPITLKSLFFGGQCNQAVCGPGEFCCNYSCSTCTPQGSYCTQQICPPVS